VFFNKFKKARSKKLPHLRQMAVSGDWKVGAALGWGVILAMLCNCLCIVGISLLTGLLGIGAS
jgi:hypothetical protein